VTGPESLDLHGILLPAVTPFDASSGDVDIAAMQANLAAWLVHPLKGIVIGGATGEGNLLDEHERRALVIAARDVIPADRVLVVATGGESTRSTIQRSLTAAQLGADAVLVQPPTFYRPAMTPATLVDHYRAVADASPVPVIVYQLPLAYATLDLPTGLIAELSHHPSIVGLKDSRGSLELIGELVESCRPGFQVLSGRANMVYASLEVGAAGAVLALAAVDPEGAIAIVSGHASGRAVEAGRRQESLARIHHTAVPHGVAGIKAALDLVGLAGGDPRPPLRPVTGSERDEIRTALERESLAAPAGPAPRGRQV
jgi:4-hydroxy-2-oxoglutarate aldolase